MVYTRTCRGHKDFRISCVQLPSVPAAGKPGQDPAFFLPDMLVVAGGRVDVEQEDNSLIEEEKHCKNRKTLPREHIRGCHSVII